ncbi:MAG: hypothetical protein Q4B16_05665 [Bacteroidia bacterium]|nr:hypothetical protein [Bacteroidia bacterium]
MAIDVPLKISGSQKNDSGGHKGGDRAGEVAPKSISHKSDS